MEKRPNQPSLPISDLHSNTFLYDVNSKTALAIKKQLIFVGLFLTLSYIDLSPFLYALSILLPFGCKCLMRFLIPGKFEGNRLWFEIRVGFFIVIISKYNTNNIHVVFRLIYCFLLLFAFDNTIFVKFNAFYPVYI